MAPVGTAVHHNVANKAKRPIPPGIQTNGTIQSSKSSPSPSMSAKKPPSSAKQPPHSASERSITASTVRPINRARRETSSQILGRNSRNSAGLRSASMAADTAAHDDEPPPYVTTDHYILKKYAGRPPSLVVHMHATHFRFDGQDGMFQYKSPMRLFLEHLKTKTVPHDLLQYFNQAGVPFYDGCLIVQVHNHKAVNQSKDVARPSSKTNAVEPSSIHSYNQCLTPSPFVPYPKESMASADGNIKSETSKEKTSEEKDKESMPAPALPSEDHKTKTSTKPKIFTLVLHPTQESLQTDLLIKAATPRGANEGRDSIDGGLVPPSTPMSIVPPTPTASSMPPPAKRQKRERMELDGSNIHAAEGQILLATNAPLMLEPTSSVEETIALLDIMSHPNHSKPPPQPKTRKRTVAEMAADEAAAAEHERYMLLTDERLSSSTNGAQNGGGTDADAQTSSVAFEPRFERFKVIEEIKRELAEKKEQEKQKQAENERRVAQQRQQQQAQEQLLAAQQKQAQQQAALQAQQAQQAAQQQQAQQAAEEKRREAVAREAQLRQEQQQQQRNLAAARAAAATPNAQNGQRPNMAQPQHAHPPQAGMANGATAAAMQNSMSAQAQPRFQAQVNQPPASSPIIRQGTPQNMSSPMVGSVPMQQTNSGMAQSPPRPSSVVQNIPMSVPMAHNMSARGSQQSHPSGTPRMPHSTPNMQHGTPINRPAMVATPRMTQASPPPNMMAQNSQMGQAMMMNNQGMNQPNPQMIAQMQAQQRAIQQQQIAAMQNGGAMNNNMNGQGMSQQQQQQMMQMMQRQMMLQHQQQAQQQAQAQQQQQQPQQNIMNQQLVQQYAQQLQNMQGNQLRQMTPQMQAQIQMARMNQMNGGGQMGNPMQRQVSGQMMNGNNINMAAIAAMQQQQAQQAQQSQQMQQPQPQAQGQPSQQQNAFSVQIQNNARTIYHKLLSNLAARSGGIENVPHETLEKLKQTSLAQAQSLFQQGMAQRRAQQQMMMQQQQMQQQQMQQQAAMQGMGGMMGPQGM